MTTEKCNGYASRETYDMSLWLANDSQLYAECRVIALEEPTDLAAGEAIREQLHDLVEEHYSSTTLDPGGIASDLINCALARVAWAELGAMFREA